MDAKNLFSSSNVRIILHNPSLIAAFIRGGKIEAYRKVIEKIFDILSQLNLAELSELLERSKSISSTVFPKEIEFYKSGTEFTNIVMLYYLIRLEKPQLIIETGVWTGKTSWTILQALADNGSGHLISIDLGVKTSCTSVLPIKEIGGLVPKNLLSKWTLEIGDANKLVPALLKKHGQIDMFYHDSDHSYEHMTFEYTTALQNIKNNGIIASDDINLNNAWSDFSKSLKNHYEIDGLFGYGHK
jgi:predicted O-methyltransferase YrrM